MEHSPDTLLDDRTCTTPTCRTKFRGHQCPACGRFSVGAPFSFECASCGITVDTVVKKGKRPTKCDGCLHSEKMADQQAKRLTVTKYDRVCGACGASFTAPSRRGKGKGGSIPRLCAECAEKRLKASIRIKARRRLIRRHGLSEETFQEILDAQGGGCAICQRPDPGRDKVGRDSWHIDHDHRCCPGQFSCGKCVRGLLCSRCNIMVGYSLDRAGTLAAAARYLKRPPATKIVATAEPPKPGMPRGRLTPAVRKG